MKAVSATFTTRHWRCPAPRHQHSSDAAIDLLRAIRSAQIRSAYAAASSLRLPGCPSDPRNGLSQLTRSLRTERLIRFLPGWSWRPGWSGRSWRPGRSAVLYHHVTGVGPGGDLDDAGRWKLLAGPPESTGSRALNFHRLGRVDLDFHGRVAAHAPYPPLNRQVSPPYAGSRDKDIRICIDRPCGHKTGGGARRNVY